LLLAATHVILKGAAQGFPLSLFQSVICPHLCDIVGSSYFNIMSDRYIYLGFFKGEAEYRSIWELDHAITVEDVLDKEEEISKECGGSMLTSFLTLLSHETIEQSESLESPKYVVKNLDSGEEFFYDFRSEAVEKFDEVVKEHGKWQEVELTVRIRHHAPPEVAP